MARRPTAPAESIVNPAVIGYQPNPAFSGPQQGDPAAAKKLLEEAGVKLPYPIKFTYPSGTPTADKQAAALKEAWDKAGFKVTLDAADRHLLRRHPEARPRTATSSGAAGVPTGRPPSPVTPPLFDSRTNLTSDSNGQDYGNYKSDKVNTLIDEAAATRPTLDEQTKALQRDRRASSARTSPTSRWRSRSSTSCTARR